MEVEVPFSHAENSAEDLIVSEIWSILLVAGFWGWVFCTIGFIIKGFPRRDFFAGAVATAWGSGVIVFYCLWILGMMNA